MITSLSSERSMSFGGSPIHDLFHLHVQQWPCVSKSVERNLEKVLFNPAKLARLKQLDLLYFEEIGMVSAEDFATIDLILQKVKNVDLPFGGVLIFASGDPKQIPPPLRNPVWISRIILTNVKMFKLSICSTDGYCWPSFSRTVI